MVDIIKIELWDYNTSSKNKLIATYNISYKKILNNLEKYKTPFWINFYGTSRYRKENSLTNKSLVKKIRKNPDEGTDWKGQLLLNIEGQ